ncbi:sensor histidine kinase [Cognatiluteimonas telluris]|uniref:sensor histidine kinase n=1 Tax=Cognatiluteimonas telluris TaxID=1104775 RepID=UPI00140B2FAB|nr:sensor histidine kinase [Lysobacter telluris]
MTTPPPDIDAAMAAVREQYQGLLRRLEANEREFRRLGRAVWRVQEDERRRLARELHDGLGQNLTALKHRLGQFGSELLPEQSALRGKLDAALALCSGALEDTRSLSRLLRPPILDDLGLEPALRWLARSTGEASGAAVVVEIALLPPLDDELQTLLFRVAQEAFTNAAKHAGARSLLLRLVAHERELQLQVLDDGRGFDPQQALCSGGSGLGSMRERLRLYGGQLELHSSPGQGTRLQATVPLDAG